MHPSLSIFHNKNVVFSLCSISVVWSLWYSPNEYIWCAFSGTRKINILVFLSTLPIITLMHCLSILGWQDIINLKLSVCIPVDLVLLIHDQWSVEQWAICFKFSGAKVYRASKLLLLVHLSVNVLFSTKYDSRYSYSSWCLYCFRLNLFSR